MSSSLIKSAGVMGWPISHSLSPRLHGYWIQKHGLKAEYIARAVKSEDLRPVLKSLPDDCLAENREFRGTNLTIPLKETALDLVDIVDPSAVRIGAVNTIVVAEDGKLIGRNTDAIGFSDSLIGHVRKEALKGGKAVILGAGGAARAVAIALSDLGVTEILICNRSRERAEALAAHITQVGALSSAAAWDQRENCLENADILVNTTSLGMIGQPSLEISLKTLKKSAVVSDIVYVPLETALLKDARLAGHVTVDGLGMLLHQAKAGFAAWFGVTPEVDEGLRRHMLEGLGQK
ncbi:MAG: shikimate dehydrogenase [Proteobacteria bacterium]|nr:shikimate dehydrogenase [Pseudomonadota bacterium]